MSKLRDEFKEVGFKRAIISREKRVLTKNKPKLLPKSNPEPGLSKRCSVKKAVLKNFANFTEKTSVLQSLSNKVAGLRDCNCIKKRDSNSQKFFCEICEFFKNIYFEEHQLTTVTRKASSCCAMNK